MPGRAMVATPMLSCADHGSTRLKGKASQSSVFGANSWRGPAELALDDSVFNIVHTGAGDHNPWWAMEMEAERLFGKVVLYNRNDATSEKRRCEMRLFGFQPKTVSGPPGCPIEPFKDFLARAPYDKASEGALVGVTNTPCIKNSMCEMGVCGKITVPTESGEHAVECGGRKGKYLVVQLPGRNRMINMREVVACTHDQPVQPPPPPPPPPPFSAASVSGVVRSGGAVRGRGSRVARQTYLDDGASSPNVALQAHFTHAAAKELAEGTALLLVAMSLVILAFVLKPLMKRMWPRT